MMDFQVSRTILYSLLLYQERRGHARTATPTKTIGLGTGIYNAMANNIDIPFELERIVDEKGKQIQATSHYGAHPFNKEEQDRIMRVNVCLSCHDYQKDAAIWKKVTDVTGFAKTDAKHREILKKIFKKGTKK